MRLESIFLTNVKIYIRQNFSLSKIYAIRYQLIVLNHDDHIKNIKNLKFNRDC